MPASDRSSVLGSAITRPVSLLAMVYAAAEGTAPMEFTTPEALQTV
jgi:hypothetical protein